MIENLVLNKQVAVAFDHGGFELGQHVIGFLQAQGLSVVNLGTPNTESCNFGDYAQNLANWLVANPNAWGVGICGSGQGISMALNRFGHVRAALIHDGTTARLSRLHNNANVATLGGRLTTPYMAEITLKIFATTPFEGGRHVARLEQLEGLGKNG